MKEKLESPNKLLQIINRKQLLKMNNFIIVDCTIDYGFPQMSVKEIEENITLGTYQLEHCKSYIIEYFKSIGDIKNGRLLQISFEA